MHRTARDLSGDSTSPCIMVPDDASPTLGKVDSGFVSRAPYWLCSLWTGCAWNTGASGKSTVLRQQKIKILGIRWAPDLEAAGSLTRSYAKKAGTTLLHMSHWPLVEGSACEGHVTHGRTGHREGSKTWDVHFACLVQHGDRLAVEGAAEDLAVLLDVLLSSSVVVLQMDTHTHGHLPLHEVTSWGLEGRPRVGAAETRPACTLSRFRTTSAHDGGSPPRRPRLTRAPSRRQP